MGATENACCLGCGCREERRCADIFSFSIIMPLLINEVLSHGIYPNKAGIPQVLLTPKAQMLTLEHVIHPTYMVLLGLESKEQALCP